MNHNKRHSDLPPDPQTKDDVAHQKLLPKSTARAFTPLPAKRLFPPEISPPLPPTAPPLSPPKIPKPGALKTATTLDEPLLSTSYDNVAQLKPLPPPTIKNTLGSDFAWSQPPQPKAFDDRFKMMNIPAKQAGTGRPFIPTTAPPSYSFVRNVYDALEPKNKHKWVFYLALLELVLALICVCLAVATVAIPSLRQYFPLYEPCWTTPLYLINALLGIVAATKSKLNLFVAHLICSVLCIVFSVICLTLGSIDWSAAGRSPMEVDCVISKYDHVKLKMLYERSKTESLELCWWHFKLAVSFWTAFMILAIILGIANLGSMVLCILRIGNCRRWTNTS